MAMATPDSNSPNQRVPFLCIPLELMDMILSHYLPYSEDGSLSRTEIRQRRIQLFHLALTCQSLKEPALRTLWSCLNSFSPLMQFLPNVKTIGNERHFYGRIGQDFREYASYVRILDLDGAQRSVKMVNGRNIVIAPTAFTQIAALFGNSPIFLSLKVIRILTGVGLDAASIPLLLRSPVQRLEVGGHGLKDGVFQEILLPIMLAGMTNDPRGSIHFPLKHLDLRLPRSHGFQPASILELARAFPYLKHLTLDIHFPHHRVSDQDRLRLNRSRASLSILQNLESIWLFSNSSGGLCPCYPAFLLEKVTRVIAVVPYFSTQPVYLLFDSLAGLRTLQRLDIVKENGTPGSPPQPVDLLPLILKTSVTHFEQQKYAFPYRLFPQRTLTFSDQEGTTLANLTTLLLPTYTDSDSAGQATWSELGNLAKQAHSLERMSIPLGASLTKGLDLALEEWQQKSTQGIISHSKLKFLAIRDIRTAFKPHSVSVGLNIAKLLNLMFSRLISIQPSQKADLDMPWWKASWSQIEELRQLIQRDASRS